MTYVKRTPVPCPTCDGLKDPRAKACMACRDAALLKAVETRDTLDEPKACTKCQVEQPAEQFRLRKANDRITGGQRRESICLTCFREDARNRARVRHEAGHSWSNATATLRHQAKARWHVDRDAIVKFVENHDGHCEICGRTAEEANMGKRRLAVDHSKAGVRGMLCHSCNTALGHFRDDPGVLRRAIEYLAQDPALPRIDEIG